jgi:hypothetical protein
MIIGITGLAGSGKSTVALRMRTHHGFHTVKFAGPLKNMLRSLGLTDRHIEGDLKEVPCDLLGGQTPRHAMQTLGTAWGRDLISPSLWIDAWKRSVSEHFSAYPRNPAMTDDLRFLSEAEALADFGGIVIRIVRPGQDDTGGHISETEMSQIKAEFTILNDGSKERLWFKVDALIRDLRSSKEGFGDD